MKRVFISLLFLVSISVKAQTPNWADDIACIVYSHCTSCHNPKGAGPMSLLTYNDVSNYASSIKNEISDGHMPPWKVNNDYNKVAHSRNLSDAEKRAFISWLDNGKPQGNIANAPTPPVYNSSLAFPSPDLKLQIPTYTVPNITQDLYRCFVIPTGQSIQKFISGIEIIPGNKNIVHHAQVFYDTTGKTTTLDNADPLNGYTSEGGVGTLAAVLLGTWVPGAGPVLVPSGMGKRLPPTAKIVLQIHYPEYAIGQVDSTKVNFLFSSSNVRNISDAAILNHATSMVNGPLFIPKNTVKTFYQSFTVPVKATILNIGPHAHLICKSMKAYGVKLNGDTIPLIDIPEWDFHWQGSYDFQKPVVIPIGTKLQSEAVYDNTSNNDQNPFNPPQDISLGEATTNEMMLFYMSYLAYKNGDENIIIDTATHQPHYNNCVTKNVSIRNTSIDNLVRLYPNPTNNIINIVLQNKSPYSIEIYNILGEKMVSENNLESLNIIEWTNGIYFVKVSQGNKLFIEKIVKE